MLAVRRSACFYTTVGLCETIRLFFSVVAAGCCCDHGTDQYSHESLTDWSEPEPACRHVVVPAWIYRLLIAVSCSFLLPPLSVVVVASFPPWWPYWIGSSGVDATHTHSRRTRAVEIYFELGQREGRQAGRDRQTRVHHEDEKRQTRGKAGEGLAD